MDRPHKAAIGSPPAALAAPGGEEVVPVAITTSPTEIDRATTAARLAPTPRWRSTYAQTALLLDLLFAGLAFTSAAALRFGLTDAQLASAEASVSYRIVVVLLVPLWVGLLGLSGAYESKHIGSGTDEYRRVLNGAVRFTAVIASVAFFAKLELARGLLAIALPLALVGTVIGRHLVRRWMARRRALGRYTEDLLVVGSPQSVSALVRHFRRATDAGFLVMGAVVAGGHVALDVDGVAVPVLGEPDHLFEVLTNTQATAVAVADTTTLPRGSLRELAWHLEGSGVDLLVAPAITDVAGPRVAVRPVAGLPLLHVEEPELEGARRLLKAVFDRVVATLAIVALAPLLLVIALAIRLTSPGPAFFRQVRVGRDGTTFTIWKFRTMRTDAEQARRELAHLNEHDGVLFKIRDDPRRTRVGAFLRRFSIDELPQLLNVATGAMSLVGPRPPIPSEVEQYGHEVRRRLLVKPGLTGLWQVSGRADLPWDESVRLDLYYVENWSLALDISILWRTFAAVVTGRGAY
jgi:exopolysaccharide biosynthesis polyprenyl glycosylphosphotransferase